MVLNVLSVFHLAGLYYLLFIINTHSEQHLLAESVIHSIAVIVMSQYCLPSESRPVVLASSGQPNGGSSVQSNFFNLQHPSAAAYMPSAAAAAAAAHSPGSAMGVGVQSPVAAAAAAANMSNMYQYYLNQPYIYTWVRTSPNICLILASASKVHKCLKKSRIGVVAKFIFKVKRAKSSHGIDPCNDHLNFFERFISSKNTKQITLIPTRSFKLL